MTRSIAAAVLFACLALAGGAPIGAQADCPQCQPLADRLRSLENELTEADGRAAALRRHLSELEASNTAIAAAEVPKVKAQFLEALDRADTVHAMVMHQAALLRRCQNQCRRRKARPPRPGDPLDETMPRAACKACEPVVERIRDLQRLRRIARDELNEVNQRFAAHEERGKTQTDLRWFGEGLSVIVEQAAAAEQVDDLDEMISRALDDLTACNWRCSGQAPPGLRVGAAPPTTPPAGSAALLTCRPCQETALALSKAEKTLAAAQSELEQQTTTRNAAPGLTAQVKQLQSDIAALKKKLESCEQGCKPKQTSQLFRGPVPYVIGGGIGVLALAAGGDTPSTTTNTSVAPPAPPVTTTPTTPQPPPQPAPQVRRPAGVLSVTSCTCVNNSAAFDGVLQFCERVRQIRTQGSGNTVTLSGDAPLPTFQGSFNESTGEFEMTSVTSIGNSASNVVIAGTVELNGNIHNLRVSYAGSNGRQTLYQLTTTP